MLKYGRNRCALNNIADTDIELAESGAADRDEILDEAERLQRRVLSMYGRILAPEDPGLLR